MLSLKHTLTIIFFTVALGVYAYFYLDSDQQIALISIAVIILVAGEFALIYLKKERSGGAYDLPEPKVDNEGEYHNDFSQVPSGSADQAPRPVDLTGNVFEHNQESMKEDMKNLGIDPDKKD